MAPVVALTLTLVALVAGAPRARPAILLALLLSLVDFGVFVGSGAWDCGGSCSAGQDATSAFGIGLFAAVIAIDLYALGVRLLGQSASRRSAG